MNTNGPDRVGFSIVLGCILAGFFFLLVPQAVKGVTKNYFIPTGQEIYEQQKAKEKEYNATVCAKCHKYCYIKDRNIWISIKKAKHARRVNGK